MQTYYFLVALFIIVAVSDLLIADWAFRRGKAEGSNLALVSVGAFVITMSYTIALFVDNYRVYSILSSIYFCGYDFMLVALMRFTWFFTKENKQQRPGLFMTGLSVYALIDMAVLAVNPFVEIAMSYVRQDTIIAKFTYDMHLMYQLHLLYSYLLVVMILYFLIRRSISAPKIYRRPYLYCIAAVIVIVLMNAVYLFLPNLFGPEDIDFSIMGYSLGAFFFGWSCFTYRSHGLLTHFHSWIFENVDQGLVLFDYDDRMLLHNKKAESVIPREILADGISLQEFMKACGIKAGTEADGLHYSFQCFINGDAMRCDYSAQLDEKGHRLGRLFVLTPTASRFDLLTSFRSWQDFKENADSLFPKRDDREVVAVCDINSLADINRKYGRVVGDQAIQRLALELRSAFPQGTFFTRSREATIAAVCMDADEASVNGWMQTVQQRMEHIDLIEEPIVIQSSVLVRREESILDTIYSGIQSMRTKKLMDKTSVHSEMLRSLMQALTQCDGDTSNHVQRTQKSGEALGRKIGLTDRQQSDLALLAILHDIGKIGIPLEILNKPGRLTEAEWKVLKTHAEKGYQIAKSSQELSGIAEMILYHHERWDGNGYPRGLKGEEIPLLSRIIAVVDAYDAMISDRSYRKGMSESAARAELRRCSGTQFDPGIVREFLNLLEENDQKKKVVVPESEVRTVPESVAAALQEEKPTKAHSNVFSIVHSVYVLDSHARIVETDANFENITGYSKADVMEGSLGQMDLIPTDDREEYFGDTLGKSGDKENIYLGHRLLRKDGTTIFVYCFGHRFYDSAAAEERTRIVIMDSESPISV